MLWKKSRDAGNRTRRWGRRERAQAITNFSSCGESVTKTVNNSRLPGLGGEADCPQHHRQHYFAMMWYISWWVTEYMCKYGLRHVMFFTYLVCFTFAAYVVRRCKASYLLSGRYLRAVIHMECVFNEEIYVQIWKSCNSHHYHICPDSLRSLYVCRMVL